MVFESLILAFYYIILNIKLQVRLFFLSKTKTGGCEYYNHYENCEDQLTSEEKIQLNLYRAEEGWFAWLHYKKKLNPNDQSLTLYVSPSHVIFYLCNTCKKKIEEYPQEERCFDSDLIN